MQRAASEEVAGLAGELMEAWNAHDLDRMAAFYAPDYEGTNVGEAGRQHGPEGIRESFARYLRAFPDLHLTEEDRVVQDNRVALFWSAAGTHLGPWMNIPATSRMVTVRGVALMTVENQRIARALYIWDVAGLLRDLGLLPEL